MNNGRTGRIRRCKSRSKGRFVRIVDKSHIQLRTWLKSTSNAHWKSLELVVFHDTGRGLMTTKPVKKDRMLLSLPSSALITTHSVLQGYMGSFLEGCGKKLTPLQVLCSYLVFEHHKQKKSAIFPYIKSAPPQYDNIVNWTTDDLKYLPNLIISQSNKLINEVKQSYTDLQHFLSFVYEEENMLHNSMTFEKYLWAWSTVNTRCVYMRHPQHHLLTEDENTYALAPFLDMLNHSADVQVNAGYNCTSGCYEIKTQTPLTKFSQAFINYGPHDNVKLLLEYGFVLPQNRNNHIKITLDNVLKSVGNIPSKEQKLSIIKENSFHRGMVLSHEGLSWNLEVCLQILAMDVNGLSIWEKLVLEDDPEGHVHHHPQVKRFAGLLLESLEQSLQSEVNTEPQNARQSMAKQVIRELQEIIEICRIKLHEPM